MSEQTVSGNIKFSEDGLRTENYFIQNNNGLLGLDTVYIEPNDLRVLADHLENLRNNK